MSSVAVFDDSNKDSPLKSLVESRTPLYERSSIRRDFGCYELKVLVISQLGYIPITCTMLSTAFYEPGQMSCILLNETGNLSGVFFQKGANVDFISILFDWNEACRNSALTAIMSTSLMVGALSGSFFAGWVADAYGRLPLLKACLLLICFANGIFSLVAVIAWPLSAALLFILGCGCGGYMVTNLVLLVECLDHSNSRLLAVSVNGWSISMVFVAVLAWTSQHWFFYHLFVASTAFVAFVAFQLWIAESCRWLAGVHRYTEARLTAIKIMSTRSEAHQIQDEYQWWQILGFAQPSVSMSNTKHSLKKYTYSDLFSHSSIYVPLLALCYCFISSSVVSFGFYFNTDALPGNRYLNMILMGISKFLMGLLPFAVSSMVGRRPIVLISLVTACTGAWFAVISQLCGIPSDHWSLIAVSLIVSAALDPAWKINHLYSAELFPTVVRNMARAVCNVGARLGSIVAPMVVHLRSVHYLIPYVTFTLFLSAQVVTAAVFLPETKNRPLPEVLPQTKIARQKDQLMEMSPKMQSDFHNHLRI